VNHRSCSRQLPHEAMHEIDFLQVSTTSKSADALTARWTLPSGNIAIAVIDAGYTDFGDTVADHVERHYGTRAVDLVISTHPDQDHVEGLEKVLLRLEVATLLIHVPRLHGYTQDAVAGQHAEDLLRIANARGTRVEEPFSGAQYLEGSVTIMGPDRGYYESLLQEQVLQARAGRALARRFVTRARDLVRNVVPGDPGETLVDDAGGTSARNNTSVVAIIEADGQRLLFTGDAGVPAINRSLDVAPVSAHTIGFLDVPHHGSHHNVDPPLLDRLRQLGPATGITAFVSSSDKDNDHPSPRVTNALKRRGFNVFTTENGNIWHRSGAPERPHYHDITPLPWLDESEGWPLSR